jgi:small subunit ribosomal protein S20
MANTKSAKKANRSSLRKRQFNLTTKAKLKTALKNLRKAVVSSGSDINMSLSSSYSALDKAVKTGFIPKRRADRKKSRLAKLIASTTQTATK